MTFVWVGVAVAYAAVAFLCARYVAKDFLKDSVQWSADVTVACVLFGLMWPFGMPVLWVANASKRSSPPPRWLVKR